MAQFRWMIVVALAAYAVTSMATAEVRRRTERKAVRPGPTEEDTWLADLRERAMWNAVLP